MIDAALTGQNRHATPREGRSRDRLSPKVNSAALSVEGMEAVA